MLEYIANVFPLLTEIAQSQYFSNNGRIEDNNLAIVIMGAYTVGMVLFGGCLISRGLYKKYRPE